MVQISDLKKIKGWWKKYNFQFVDWVVNICSTPEAFWCAVLLIILPEFIPSSISIVSYISQNVIQLLFLFLLLISGARLSKKTEARALKDHANITLITKKLDVIEQKIEKFQK